MAMIITPESGNHKDIGQRLLSLADHPHQVQWVTWPVAGYQVDDELFQRFHQPELPQTEMASGEVENGEDKGRRRGRPRKTETDNGKEVGE